MVRKNPNRYEWKMPLELVFLGQSRYSLKSLLAIFDSLESEGRNSPYFHSFLEKKKKKIGDTLDAVLALSPFFIGVAVYRSAVF